MLAIAEAWWPEGIQAWQGNPVVLELDPLDSDLARLRELGYEVFTSADSLRGYVRRRNQEAVGPLKEQAEPVADALESPSQRDPDPGPEAAVCALSATWINDELDQRHEPPISPTHRALPSHWHRVDGVLSANHYDRLGVEWMA